MRTFIIAAMALSLAAAPLATSAHDPAKKKDVQHRSAPHPHGASVGEPGDPKAASRTVEVTMHDSMRFEPAIVDVKKGETIRFVVKNLGATKHEMVLGTAQELKDHAALMQKYPDMEHDDPNGVMIEPGKTRELTWTFTVPGDVTFACLVPGHYEAGMMGRVDVSRHAE